MRRAVVGKGEGHQRKCRMKNVECRVESVGRIVVLSGCDAGWVADFDFETARLLEIGRQV